MTAAGIQARESLVRVRARKGLPVSPIQKSNMKNKKSEIVPIKGSSAVRIEGMGTFVKREMAVSLLEFLGRSVEGEL